MFFMVQILSIREPLHKEAPPYNLKSSSNYTVIQVLKCSFVFFAIKEVECHISSPQSILKNMVEYNSLQKKLLSPQGYYQLSIHLC
jgi:hypothetical protein